MSAPEITSWGGLVPGLGRKPVEQLRRNERQVPGSNRSQAAKFRLGSLPLSRLAPVLVASAYEAYFECGT